MSSYNIQINQHTEGYYSFKIIKEDESGFKLVADRSSDAFPTEALAMSDALLYLELETLRGPGRWRVWYMRPAYFSTFISGEKPPMRETLMQTHRALRCVDVPTMEQVFGYMQGENWSPNGEARPLIEQKGLKHTSMSVGDVIEDLETGKFYACAFVGFTEL